MKFELITEFTQLKQICDDFARAKIIMVDTEFVRTRTFYPKLGLIQLYDGHRLALVDPFTIADLTPLWQVLASPSVLKVLHACSEDLEVFLHSAGFMPSPIIDTQIMAAFAGHGVSAGFAALTQIYLDIELDKSQSRANWCARPLTAAQLDYAAADVYYLWDLYARLNGQLDQIGLLEAAKQESAALLLKRAKRPDPDLIYVDIKNAWQLKPQQLAILQKLAKWRLLEAQRRDLALNFVIKDTALWTIAKYGIKTKEKMLQHRIDKFEVERHGSKLISLVNQAGQLQPDEYPQPINRLIDMPAYKEGLQQIKAIVDDVAAQLGLHSEFVGSKKQMNQFLKWVWFDNKTADKKPDLLSGWRADYFEAKLNELIL